MAQTEPWLERLWREGRWEELLGLATAELAAARLAQDPLDQAQAFSFLASVHGALGNWRESLRASRAALRIRRQVGDALGTAPALAGLAAAYAANRGTRQALSLFQMTNNAFRGLEETEERCHAAAALGEVLIGLGQAFLLRQREGAISASCLRSFADLYLEAGRCWEGAEMYRMAINHAREQGTLAEIERTKARISEVTHPQDLHRGRLTFPGLKAPGWEQSHYLIIGEPQPENQTSAPRKM